MAMTVEAKIALIDRLAEKLTGRCEALARRAIEIAEALVHCLPRLAGANGVRNFVLFQTRRKATLLIPKTIFEQLDFFSAELSNFAHRFLVISFHIAGAVADNLMRQDPVFEF